MPDQSRAALLEELQDALAKRAQAQESLASADAADQEKWKNERDKQRGRVDRVERRLRALDGKSPRGRPEQPLKAPALWALVRSNSTANSTRGAIRQYVDRHYGSANGFTAEQANSIEASIRKQVVKAEKAFGPIWRK